MSDESALNDWLTTASPPEWVHPSIKIVSQQELDAGLHFSRLPAYGASELYAILSLICVRLVGSNSDSYVEAWSAVRTAFVTYARFTYLRSSSDGWIMVPAGFAARVEAIRVKYAHDHHDGES